MSELYRDRGEPPEDSSKNCITHLVVRKMIAVEMEKSTSHCYAPLLTGLVEG